MLNCSQCSAYNICTACDGDLVVNATGDGCTGKIYHHKNTKLLTARQVIYVEVILCVMF